MRLWFKNSSVLTFLTILDVVLPKSRAASCAAVFLAFHDFFAIMRQKSKRVSTGNLADRRSNNKKRLKFPGQKLVKRVMSGISNRRGRIVSIWSCAMMHVLSMFSKTHDEQNSWLRKKKSLIATNL